MHAIMMSCCLSCMAQHMCGQTRHRSVGFFSDLMLENKFCVPKSNSSPYLYPLVLERTYVVATERDRAQQHTWCTVAPLTPIFVACGKVPHGGFWPNISSLHDMLGPHKCYRAACAAMRKGAPLPAPQNPREDICTEPTSTSLSLIVARLFQFR